MVALPPLPCVNTTLCPEPFLTKYSFWASVGLIVMVCVPDGDPPRTRTRYCPSDKVPSLVVRVLVVPDRLSDNTPLMARSVMSMFVLTMVPQEPASSPVPILVIPVLVV